MADLFLKSHVHICESFWLVLLLLFSPKQPTHTYKCYVYIYICCPYKCHLQSCPPRSWRVLTLSRSFPFHILLWRNTENNCLLCFLIPNCAAQNNGIQRHQNAREERKVTPMERPNQGQDVSWLDEEGEDGGGIAGGTGEKERQSIEISWLTCSLIFDRRWKFFSDSPFRCHIIVHSGRWGGGGSSRWDLNRWSDESRFTCPAICLLLVYVKLRIRDS